MVWIVSAIGATCTQAGAPDPGGKTSDISPDVVVKRDTFRAEVSDACRLRVSGVVTPPNVSWKVSLVRGAAGDESDRYTLALDAPEPRGRQSRLRRDECVVYPAPGERNVPSSVAVCKLKEVIVTGSGEPIKLAVEPVIGKTNRCARHREDDPCCA